MSWTTTLGIGHVIGVHASRVVLFHTPFIPLSDENGPFRDFSRNSIDLCERIEQGSV